MDRETGSCAGEGSCSARGGYVGQMLIGCSQCVLTVCWAGHGRRGYGADCAREGSWWAVRGRVLCALRCDATLAWRRGRAGLPRAGRGRHVRWDCGLFPVLCNCMVSWSSRARCDKHERPTVVRRDIHQTRLGVRSFRCPLRARQRGCARSRSTSPNLQCCPLTIMGGAAVPMSSCPEELRGHGMDQARPTATSTAEGSEITTWVGRTASLACSGDLLLKR